MSRTRRVGAGGCGAGPVLEQVFNGAKEWEVGPGKERPMSQPQHPLSYTDQHKNTRSCPPSCPLYPCSGPRGKGQVGVWQRRMAAGSLQKQDVGCVPPISGFSEDHSFQASHRCWGHREEGAAGEDLFFSVQINYILLHEIILCFSDHLFSTDAMPGTSCMFSNSVLGTTLWEGNCISNFLS